MPPPADHVPAILIDRLVRDRFDGRRKTEIRPVLQSGRTMTGKKQFTKTNIWVSQARSNRGFHKN